MSSDTVAIFAKFMGEGSISDYLLSFCKEAQMTCLLSSSSDAMDSFIINYADIATDSFMINYHVDSATNSFMISYADSATGSHLDFGKEPGKFFKELALKSENVMLMPDITNKMLKRSFLPWKIFSKLPFSTLKLSQLNQILRVKENSPMGKILACTVAQCESAAIYGEKKSCVSSIEDMIDFATAILGHDVMVLFTTSTGGSKQQVMVGQVKRMESSDTRKSIVCQQILFPSIIYYCHSFLDVEIYEVNILNRNSEVQINQAMAICHFNMSTWSPNHPAFLDLKSSPGQTEACHWAYENNLVWIVIWWLETATEGVGDMSVEGVGNLSVEGV